MDTREIILFLSEMETFPAKLGASVGCEKALLWFKLYKRFGEGWFEVIDGFGADVGIKNSKGLILEMFFYGLLLKKEENQITFYKANIEKIFELCDHVSLNVDPTPPFTSFEFIEAVNKYIRVMKEKGRNINKVQLYEELKNHPVDVCIKALTYSATTGYVTLYWDGAYGKPKGGAEKPKENAGRVQPTGRPVRFSTGGSKITGAPATDTSFPTIDV
jgi:hypothetical protein